MVAPARSRSSWAIACSLAVSLVSVGSTHAQDEEDYEVVVTTGSYIKGSPEDAASPVQVLRHEDIVASGVSDMAELVRNLESASGSDTAPQNAARFNGNSGSGLANVNLRGLGPTSTLVLLDGKRLPYAGQKLSDGDRFVDINSIPITMVERVEVLKGGSSAIYGSDAIAGVVNFITRRDFEGLELTAKYQRTGDGPQTDATIGGIFGWASEDARTHIVLGGEYFDRGQLDSIDRPELTSEVYDKQGHSIVNRMTFFGGDPNCTEDADLGFFRDDGFSSDPNSCNRQGHLTGTFTPAQKRGSLMLTFDHAFNEAAQLYGQISYLDSSSENQVPVHNGPIEPKFATPAWFGLGRAVADPSQAWLTDPSLAINGGGIPLAAIPVGGGLELVDYTARVPGIDADRDYYPGNDQETTRYQLGMKGDFEMGSRPWSYDLSYTRGDSEFRTHYLGLDKDRLEFAHYGLGGPDCTPNGSLDGTVAIPGVGDLPVGFVLAGADGVFDGDAEGLNIGILEPTMIALMGNVDGLPFINPDNVAVAMTSTNVGRDGCQFFNPYLSRANEGQGNSEELIRWLEFEMIDAQKSETFLSVADFVISGDIFDMKGGSGAMALGLQYREEGRKTTVNEKNFGSVNSFGQISGEESVAGLSENLNYDADRDVVAAFFEFVLPVLETLDIQLAGRYEDYGGGVGSSFDPKLAFRWQAHDTFALRGSVSSSFRGPALAQLEEGTGFSLEFGVRDVIGENANPAGQNCVRTGRCPIPDDDSAPTITIVKQGFPTPDLQPETAVSYNLGGIWSPVDGLTIGLDYYVINFEDKIIDVPTQSFLTEERALFEDALAAGQFVIATPNQPDFLAPCDPTAAEFDPDMPRGELCQVDPRAYAVTPENSAFADGNITRRIDASRDLQIIGSGAINTGNVDTDGIDFDLTYAWDTNAGTFIVDTRFNWILNYDVKNFPVGQPDFQAAGFTNNDPNKRLSRSMPDLKGNLGLSWARDRHAARGNIRFVGDYVDNGTANNIIDDGKLGAYYSFDLSYSFAADVRGSDLIFTVGAIDLFDASLPKLKNAGGTDWQTFDARGQRFFGSVTFRM